MTDRNLNLIVPPRSVPLAEKALIGCLTFGRKVAQQVRSTISAEDLDLEAHRFIFQAAMEVLDSGSDTDAITIIEALRVNGKLGDVGGGTYIDECYQSVMTSDNVGEYARLVRWASLERKIKTQVLVTANESTPEQVSVLGELILAQRGLSISGFMDFRNDLPDVLDAYITSKEKGLNIGFENIDPFLQHIHGGQILTIGARAGCGKTAIMTKIMLNIASEYGVNCCYLTTEMTTTEVLCRVLPIVSGVHAWKLNTRTLSLEDQRKLYESIPEKLTHLPIKVFAHGWPKLEDIQSAVIQSKCRVLFIDYLQRCRFPERKGELRTYAIADFMRRLKTFVQDTRITAVLACQLNRKRDKEKEAPTMSDLSDSGSVENESDKVALVWEREFDDMAPAYGNKGYEWIQAKNRRGRSGASVTARLQLDQNLVDMITLDYEKPTADVKGVEAIEENGDDWMR